MKIQKTTYDIQFDDNDYSNGLVNFKSFDDCKKYIAQYNGTNHSYFKDYKGGIVSIVRHCDGKTLYEENIY